MVTNRCKRKAGAYQIASASLFMRVQPLYERPQLGPALLSKGVISVMKRCNIDFSSSLHKKNLSNLPEIQIDLSEKL